jgi:hypothetical protein
MSIESQLTEHLARIGTAPFLFVGSGLSRRYIELEAWEQLLRRFVDGLPQPFAYYFGQAERNLPRTASLLSEAFYDVWWNDPRFQKSRESFIDQIQDRASCLKYEISQYMAAKKYGSGENSDLDAEVELLKKVTVDGIITTNWDTLIESLFPEFEVFIGQEQILFSTSQGIAEIYKIHGCSTEPNSLVLTASDYEDFNRRNPYLAAKLLTIFVEHPVIFIGYSLSDENVTDVLKQIASCLTTENIHKLTDRLLFLQRADPDKGDSFESSVVQVGGYTLPVTIIRTNDFSQVYRPLGTAKRRFSARLLRKMKEHIYELVKSNDPKSKLAVIDINDADNFEDLEVVYGVGVLPRLGSAGYSAISRLDLMKDVISAECQYEARRIVEDTLPELLKQAKYVPLFRYLREAQVDPANLHERVARAATAVHEDFYPPQQYRGELAEVQRVCQSIDGVHIRFGTNAFFYIPMLRRDQIDLEALRKYIVGNMNVVNSKNSVNATYFRSLICFYDWLKYSDASGQTNDGQSEDLLPLFKQG